MNRNVHGNFRIIIMGPHGAHEGLDGERQRFAPPPSIGLLRDPLMQTTGPFGHAIGELVTQRDHGAGIS